MVSVQTLTKYIYPEYFDIKAAIKALQYRTEPNAPVTVLSNEVWSGHPFSGGITSYEYARRIKCILPDAKILIIVRNQEDMILSAYAHFMTKSGGICNLYRFLVSGFQNQIPSNNPIYYCYHILVEKYVNLFGQENVLVLPVELLIQPRGLEFIRRIYSFLDIEPLDVQIPDDRKNVRDYKEYVLISRLRFLNRLAYPNPANGNASLNLPLIRRFLIISKVFIIPALEKTALRKDKALIKQYFSPYAAQTNQRLQEYVDVDLRGLGYSF